MRNQGKTRVLNLASAAALNRGEHLHVVGKEFGMECLGGNPDCKLWNEQLEKLLKP
jgi:hypothetical protein